jgi:macrodomain Ter protein organizer (MatP/YcbG family)
LGINGGNISAFEFRLAIALGAKVGIIAESGRAAAEIFEDPDWKDAHGLMRLPNDPQTVRAFVQQPMPPEVITKEDCSNLARDAHEAYVKNRKAEPKETDMALLAWDELPEDFKRSNIQQIEHIEAKLKAAGLKLRRISPGEVQLIEFKDVEREKMAEMEHGRFITERLLAGWKYGTERDPVKKTSPTLIPWSILSEEEKKKDREAVDFLPGKLKEYGYEIIRPQNK